MISDILQSIINYNELKYQIRCMGLNKYSNQNTYIYSLMCDRYMDQAILEKHIFSRLKKLNCCGCTDITSVNHLSETLEVLDCSGSQCGVNQNGISQLNKLKILFCGQNYKINNVKESCNTLTELHCGWECGINQTGINQLHKLKKLYCNGNTKIIDVNHLKNVLEELECCWDCGIEQKGISDLCNLRKIDCSGNQKIDDLNHLAGTLEEVVCCGYCCRLADSGISQLRNLKVLESKRNPKIKK